MSFAEDLFKVILRKGKLEDELLDLLDDAGIVCYDFHYDHYDSSLELDRCSPEFRLTPEHFDFIKGLGFERVWLNHTNGWETYYYGDYKESRKNTKLNNGDSDDDE